MGNCLTCSLCIGSNTQGYPRAIKSRYENLKIELKLSLSAVKPLDLEKISTVSHYSFHLNYLASYNVMGSIFIITSETEMDKMTEEDRKRILESPPVGTFALMSVVIGGMVVAWLFLYYGVFLPRG